MQLDHLGAGGSARAAMSAAESAHAKRRYVARQDRLARHSAEKAALHAAKLQALRGFVQDAN
jgi:shikimate 5-dehydrogenase